MGGKRPTDVTARPGTARVSKRTLAANESSVRLAYARGSGRYLRRAKTGSGIGAGAGGGTAASSSSSESFLGGRRSRRWSRIGRAVSRYFGVPGFPSTVAHSSGVISCIGGKILLK